MNRNIGKFINFLWICSLFCRFKNALFSLLIPSICAYCKKFLSDRAIFCSLCADKIIPIVSNTIDVTQNFSMTVFAITDYKDPLKRMILAKGWSDTLASHQLGQLLWKKTPLSLIDFDCIVPIPLHWTRYAWRGFNQAEEIAKVIQKKKNVPIVHLLKRIKKTAFQSGLVATMRAKNVKEAFALNGVNQQDYKGKHILLIDDLMTTGSTLSSAAKELLLLRPKKITVAVICRVV